MGRDPLTWRRAAMAKVEANISMSLDGFVTGPNLNRYLGLGEGGEILHAWTGESRAMDFAMGEERQIAGSIITSRKVYDETEGWRAENGFYRMPVFVVTHRPHDVVVRGETTFTFVTVVFTCVGGVVATRRPTNPVGWIFGMMGLGGPIQYVNRRVRAQGIVIAPGSLPAARFAAWVQDWIWVPLIGLVGLLFLLFPHEKLSTKASRRVAVAGTWASAATIFSLAFLPPHLDSYDLENPVGLMRNPEATEAIAGLSSLAMMVCVATATLLLFARFRWATGVERQQLKWFAFASALASLGLIVGIARRRRWPAATSRWEAWRWYRWPRASPSSSTASTTSTASSSERWSTEPSPHCSESPTSSALRSSNRYLAP
jgi:hypothetical protein